MIPNNKNVKMDLLDLGRAFIVRGNNEWFPYWCRKLVIMEVCCCVSIEEMRIGSRAGVTEALKER